MSTEHQRIEHIRALFERPNASISLGIGDDCAVLAPSPNARVWTVDAAIEDVHFSRTFMSLGECAYRAFMAATSDIAAMGASASAALCALAFPATMSDSELEALLQGLAQASDALLVPIVGGNLARARELSITTTVLGECRRAVSRSGAQTGEGVFVTGRIGGASLGLAALQHGERREGRFGAAIRSFLRPRARLELSASLAEHASAAIDISDGLAQDLAHLCRASGLAATIELDRVPRLPDFAALAHALNESPARLLLGGGEDYEILFTAPPECVPKGLGTQIGFTRPGDDVRFLDASGADVSPPSGFDHFR